MFRVAIFCCLLAVSLAANVLLDSEWQTYKETYTKFYEPHMEDSRRAIWEENIKYIQQHNYEAERGLHTHTLGINKYSDLTNEEFVAVMNGYKHNITYDICHKFYPPTNVDLPYSVNWTTKGYVTPVKDQGQCGSCWAFSTTGSLEGQHFKKTGKLVSLSEKNLIDCSRPQGNNGCKGGEVNQAFAYIMKNKGIDTEASYPYQPVDGTCKFNKANIGAIQKKCWYIQKNSEAGLQAAVALIGPIAVSIDASKKSFQHYKSGIYNEPACSSIRLGHSVLVVGYGTQSGLDYWLVKNSWGTSWGMQGYIMMSRNKRNRCGIASEASFPTM